VNAPRLLAGLISVALAVIPLAPQEHVHETRSGGELHVVIHRHIEAHGIFRHQAASNLASFDDDHDPTLTLTLGRLMADRSVMADYQLAAFEQAQP
jgi:hypothetical protein